MVAALRLKGQLSSQTDVNATDLEGNTPLHYAATEGHADVIDVLLKHGAMIDQVSEEGYTPLHEAAQHANKGVVEKLLEKGADINQRTSGADGKSALYFASAIGATPIVKILLDHGAKFGLAANDNYQRTPVHHAALENEAEVLKELLSRLTKEEKLAALESRDGIGRSALHLASMRGNKEAISELLDQGADISARLEDGRTPLHVVAEMGQSLRYVESLSILVSSGHGDVNQADANGLSPLHYAVKKQHEAVVVKLLELGADTGILDDTQWDDLRKLIFSKIPLKGDTGRWLVILLAGRFPPSSKERDEFFDELLALVTIGKITCDIAFLTYFFSSVYSKMSGYWEIVGQKYCAKYVDSSDKEDAAKAVQAFQKAMFLDPVNRSTSSANRFYHDGVNCSDCLNPIVGIRHLCLPCAGHFNLCSRCFKSSKGPHQHASESNTDVVQIPQPFVLVEEGTSAQE